ncbi:MAG: hypothetical protein JWO73_391 [Candidatus Taylorbacteria bacterium]|nr:hypothetical protein [Candidatus Taylorbacteria bacterium]
MKIETSTILEVKNLGKRYGKQEIFSGLNFTLEKNKVTVIYGKSGIGKTTFLRLLVLLDKPDTGNVIVEREDAVRDGEIINEHLVRGKIGIVFQDFYLWDNKTILDNIIEALIQVKKMDAVAAAKIARRLADKLHLPRELFGKYPPELSRGQRQRVAIARTLAMDPDIILFDEPTASLDEALVEQVSGIIKSLRVNGKTILIVSHDSRFTKTVADTIVHFQDLL